MLRWLGLPVEASAQAPRIDLIIVLVHWLMLAMFIGWASFFVYVLVRFRRGAHPKARYEGTSGRLARLAEIGGVVDIESSPNGTVVRMRLPLLSGRLRQATQRCG